MPSFLRAVGLAHETPDQVALRMLRSFDQRDMRSLMSLVDRDAPEAYQAIHTIAMNWPIGALQEAGSRGNIGPYIHDAWYARVPEGSVRFIPVRLTCRRGMYTVMLRLRLDADGWRITSARLHSSNLAAP